MRACACECWTKVTGIVRCWRRAGVERVMSCPRGSFWREDGPQRRSRSRNEPKRIAVPLGQMVVSPPDPSQSCCQSCNPSCPAGDGVGTAGESSLALDGTTALSLRQISEPPPQFFTDEGTKLRVKQRSCGLEQQGCGIANGLYVG